MNKEIKTIELFAGVGGFRIGLENANSKYNIVWSNQWEPSTKIQHASMVYEKRFGKKNHSNEDISKVNVEDIPDHNLLVGGFPCQDYSVASTLSNSGGISGKKGVLWWEIIRILTEKNKIKKAPDYLILENVDRLLQSPASQRGRDFAIILSSLSSLGYAVEWRVINAAEYGMPQRRRRTFIFATKKGTNHYKTIEKNTPPGILNNLGIFAKSFPIESIESNSIIENKISLDLVQVTNGFNINTPKKNAFLNSGYMIDGKYFTVKSSPNYSGEYRTLNDCLQDENEIPDDFYLSEDELVKWEYQKGAKSIERINKKTGFKYNFAEGKMDFPDSIDKPARTIITGEGGKAASRCKHVVKLNGKFRRLTPIELERLNMFPDEHTHGVTDTKRAFLMGNALVVGIIERIGKTLDNIR